MTERHSPHKRHLSTFGQFFAFGVVGVANTLISLLVYYLFIFLGVSYLVANTLGFIAGVLNAYFWNSRCVFKAPEAKKSFIFLKMSVAYGATFLLSCLLMYVMIERMGISDFLAPVLNLFLTTPANFFLNKCWAFKVSRYSSGKIS